MKKITLLFPVVFIASQAIAQKAKPEDTELYKPVPAVVVPGVETSNAPSDAIVLFDGSNLNQWTSTDRKGQPALWTVENGAFTVKKGTGNIETKQNFTDYQLHLEWKIPVNITGKNQARGNSGLFLATTGPGNDGYELQILDNYNNDTYVNGQVGSIYKQRIPLVKPVRKPGEWQTYDVVWTAPRFNDDGTVKSKARVTAFLNGVLVQNAVELDGETLYIGKPYYRKHGASPIRLQDHGDPSEPISFRNIWVRQL